MSPVVFQRRGNKIEEVPSKLYDEIQEAVQDRETAWKMWAFTKTADFKNTYKDVEYDELGEVTFPSLIKALGMEDAYNRQKGARQASREYGFYNHTFEDPKEAMRKVNDFNKKEKKFVAFISKEKEGYKVGVFPRTAANVEAAREQSYNNALTGEIIHLMRSIGFDVGFVSNVRYDGLFDPQNAVLHDGLLQVIKIAKGERGEEALPEEFSHLIIEGLASHPLVKRLLETITFDQVHEVLGENYDEYYQLYNGDFYKLKKEAAGKLLGQYITKKGTISQNVVKEKKGLLARVWNWAKGLFSKVSQKQIHDARMKAHDAISDIYDLIASGEAVPIIDKKTIMSSEQLYKLRKEFETNEHIAREAVLINARMIKSERSLTGRVDIENAKRHIKMRDAIDPRNFYTCISTFLNDTQKRLDKLVKEQARVQNNEENDWVTDIREVRDVARLVRRINEVVDGYEEILDVLVSLEKEDNWVPAGFYDAEAEALSKNAKICRDILRSLINFKQDTERNILYNASRTVYRADKVRGIGKAKDRNRVMELHEILEHADRDINFVDRWLSAMSDADDAFLTIIDGLVKNQQYERDMEMIEWSAQINLADEELRKAGYTSDFMYERDAEGVPTGRIISPYDWDTFNEQLKQKKNELWEKGKRGQAFRKAIDRWMIETDSNHNSRTIMVYIDQDTGTIHQVKDKKQVPSNAKIERMPNPQFEGYGKNINVFESLAPAQKTYYNKMMAIKTKMMTKIPHRGQYIYNAVYISKDLVEGIMDNSTGNPIRATLDYYKRKFVRRPDDIGFGVNEDFTEDVKQIIQENPDDLEKAADNIIKALADATDQDIYTAVSQKALIKALRRNKDDINKAVKEVLEEINASNFYIIDTDFAGHRIQKLPIYYTRRLKDMKMLSTDFSSTLLAYSAMAVNYEKMNEVVDVIEVAREYQHNERDIREIKGGKSTMSKFTVFDRVYRSYVERAGRGSNIAERLDDYIDSVVYEERKLPGDTLEVLGVNLDTAKIADAIKDYTGLLGLGFNLLSSVSNIAVGKLQQWIEAAGGEYFNVKDYAKAIRQYGSLIRGCITEMASPVKKNKLSLLIQMFDPMGDYFESLRDQNHSKNVVSRILGNNALAYIGMNAGEHMLHCQTMLAILNHVKLTDSKTKEKISLYDALEVKTDPEDGITRLELKDGLTFERDMIDDRKTINGLPNKNYMRPLLDKDGKIKTEEVELKDNELVRYIFKKKKVIRKVNDSLNGAFSANDKGAFHRKAVGRLVLQFRQWMPAHYMRRFARGHYDNDLEQWREGYYLTIGRFLSQMAVDIVKGKKEYLKVYANLSEHEKANIRRAGTEISLFWMLWLICKIGGRVKDQDRSWWDKMALYQLHRMNLEVGASVPGLGFTSNLIQLLQSPAPTLSTFEKFNKILNFNHAFDEIQSGRYEGWWEIQRDAFKLIPALDQVQKAYYFDESLFSMFEKD